MNRVLALVMISNESCSFILGPDAFDEITLIDAMPDKIKNLKGVEYEERIEKLKDIVKLFLPIIDFDET